MHSKFLNLDEEKQQRIINAALNEFALKGYDDASTNEIVKVAGISKGILFHYFKNKKQLFLFLYDYCMELVMEEFDEKLDLSERDMIKRLSQTSLIKYDIMKRYPALFKFTQKAYMEQSAKVRADLDSRNNNLIKESYEKLFSDVDLSLFKPGIDLQKAISIMNFTFEGLATAELAKLNAIPGYTIDYDKLFTEAKAYLETFRECFYK